MDHQYFDSRRERSNPKRNHFIKAIVTGSSNVTYSDKIHDQIDGKDSEEEDLQSNGSCSYT